MKNATPCYRQVRLQDINLTDRSYILNPFPQDPEQDLLHSISNFGMLQPPLLLEKKDHTLTVLSGRRRIEAYLQVSKAQECHLTALIIPFREEKPEYQLHLLTTLLQHQLLGGSLTVIEQAIFFQKATLVLEEQEVLSLLPVLGLKAKPHISGELISLLDLESAVQLGLHRGIISQRSGKKLSRFAPVDQKQLAEVINTYQLGGSKQQKLIEHFFQLTQREQVSVEVLLGRWQDKEKDKQLNGPQRASSLLRCLTENVSRDLRRQKKHSENFALSSNYLLEYGLSTASLLKRSK